MEFCSYWLKHLAESLEYFQLCLRLCSDIVVTSLLPTGICAIVTNAFFLFLFFVLFLFLFFCSRALAYQYGGTEAKTVSLK